MAFVIWIYKHFCRKKIWSSHERCNPKASL